MKEMEISFEYPDVYTKKNRRYTGKITVHDRVNTVYAAFDFNDERAQPPINFSSIIYISPSGQKEKDGKVVWVSSDTVKKDLLQAIGQAIEIASQKIGA